MDLFTAKDIAKRVSSTNRKQDIARVLRQIQHWTARDLLTTSGPKEVGTGRSRLYNLHQLHKSAILAELARYGINVGELEGFGEWADVLLKSKPWHVALEGKRDVFIEMTWATDGASQWAISEGEPGLNAIHTHGKTRHRQPKDLLEPNWEEFTTAIVINIRKVFTRINA